MFFLHLDSLMETVNGDDEPAPFVIMPPSSNNIEVKGLHWKFINGSQY